MSRSGFTGHFGGPWSAVDTLEIDFVAHMKHLSKAGYNVLAYDLRNHGNSGAANGGICGIGRYEWRDVVGAQLYVQNHPKLSRMQVGLYNRCTGGNAAFEAMYRRPELFKDIKCFFGPLVSSTEKALFWIENTHRHFDGYNFFGLFPGKMIEFFDIIYSSFSLFFSKNSVTVIGVGTRVACSFRKL
ncbi:MAG: hypothetical protein AAGA10_02490 [Bacteroidota bacterium]